MIAAFVLALLAFAGLCPVLAADNGPVQPAAGSLGGIKTVRLVVNAKDMGGDDMKRTITSFTGRVLQYGGVSLTDGASDAVLTMDTEGFTRSASYAKSSPPGYAPDAAPRSTAYQLATGADLRGTLALQKDGKIVAQYPIAGSISPPKYVEMSSASVPYYDALMGSTWLQSLFKLVWAVKGTDALIAALEDTHPDIVEGAIEALGGTGDPRVPALLCERIKGDSLWDRDEVIFALGQTGDPRAIDCIGESLHSRDFAPMAAGALAKIKDPRAIDKLGGVLRDMNPSFVDFQLIPVAVVHALGTTGDPSAVEPLMIGLKKCRVNWGPDGELVDAICDALVAIGKPAVEPLAAALASESSKPFLLSGVRALGRIGDPRALEVLDEIAKKDEDLTVHDAAKEAAARIRSGKTE